MSIARGCTDSTMCVSRLVCHGEPGMIFRGSYEGQLTLPKTSRCRSYETHLFLYFAHPASELEGVVPVPSLDGRSRSLVPVAPNNLCSDGSCLSNRAVHTYLCSLEETVSRRLPRCVPFLVDIRYVYKSHTCKHHCVEQ